MALSVSQTCWQPEQVGPGPDSIQHQPPSVYATSISASPLLAKSQVLPVVLQTFSTKDSRNVGLRGSVVVCGQPRRKSCPGGYGVSTKGSGKVDLEDCCSVWFSTKDGGELATGKP